MVDASRVLDEFERYLANGSDSWYRAATDADPAASLPGPIASAGAHDEPPRTNGNGGSHGQAGEASAFRELLTEFRNLTERYGQALLALGEARGEVAGLRSRVDQLEARLDLRLPPPLDAAPMAWDSLSVPASTPEPSRAIPRPAAPRLPARRKARPSKARPSKARSSREAVAGFADALARAQDPNAADLGEARLKEEERPPEESTEPSTATAAAAEVAIQEAWEGTEVAPPDVGAAEIGADEGSADELAQEASPPEPVALSEVPAPENSVEEAAPEEPTAEVEPPTYSAVVVEPDWFADGDFAWLDAADMPQSSQSEPASVTPVEAVPEPESVAAEAEPEPAEAEAPQQAQPEAQALEEPEPPVEPDQEAEPEPVPEFQADAEFEPWQPPEPSVEESSAEPGIADEPEPPRMSAAVAVQEVEEEVMWLGREPESSPVARDEPRLEQRAEADAWPEVDAAPTTEVVRPPLAMTEDELARLALDEGWDEAEIAAIRAMITPLPSSTVDLPGAAELHEAMAALEAVPVQTAPPYRVSRQWAKQAPEDETAPRQDDWAFEAEPALPPPAPTRPPADLTSELRRSVADAGWLRRRQGPAAAAYRRLRRLFPG